LGEERAIDDIVRSFIPDGPTPTPPTPTPSVTPTSTPIVPTPSVTPSVTPTNTPTVTPTTTPTLTPTPTEIACDFTFSILPTPTPTPTNTSTPTTTPTETPTPTPTLTPTSTSTVIPLLLNQYPGDSNSYSLRKLDNTYNTNIIEVRRSSDDTTQNIGFVGDNLDTSSLMSFVGTGATDYGYIKTWYSQDVNNRDATQTNNNNQPMIVSGGTLITENGEPTIRFDGSTSYLIFDGTILANTKYSTFQVHSRASSKSGNYFIGGRTQAQNANLIIGYASDTSYLLAQYSNDLSATISSFTGSTLELFNTFNISTGKSIYKSDVLIGSNAETTDLISFNNAQIGLYDVGFFYEGNISELILYPTDQLSNRTAINTNINNHYNLY
jgi:hypothetical protein